MLPSVADVRTILWFPEYVPAATELTGAAALICRSVEATDEFINEGVAAIALIVLFLSIVNGPVYLMLHLEAVGVDPSMV